MSPTFHALLLLSWLVVCAWQDATSRRISNWLTFGGIVLALLYLVAQGESWLGGNAGAAALAALLALLLGLPGYCLGRLGAADVKLLLCIGLASHERTLLVCVIGAGLALFLWSRTGARLWTRLAPQIRATLVHLAPNETRTYPFAPFATVGLLASFF
ncbi:Type IV leader peptidase family protein [compost metagenome]